MKHTQMKHTHINLPDMSGIDVTCQLHSQGTSTAILLLTGHKDSQLILKLLENGAIGYVLENDVASAIRAASCGESWLSPVVTSHVVRRAVSQRVGLLCSMYSGHSADLNRCFKKTNKASPQTDKLYNERERRFDSNSQMC